MREQRLAQIVQISLVRVMTMEPATATATGTGIITYAWSNGGTAASINSLATGAYTVTVTDANGCTAVDSTEVNELLRWLQRLRHYYMKTCTNQ